jgi:hypothetical protein
MRLYRVVSWEEVVDIRQCGTLRQGPNSLEGKWFAERFSHAEAWGRSLYPAGTTGLHVIDVDVADDIANRWFRWDMLDTIGPGRYAEAGELGLITIVRETPIFPWSTHGGP